MKLIEAMKKLKNLEQKAQDLREKVKQNCVILDIETSPYENPKAQLRAWLQGHGDLVAEIERLRVCIQKTNLATVVEIRIGENVISKPIAAWIHRRKDLAKLEQQCWGCLGDKELPPVQKFNQSTGEQREIKLVRFYSAEERDRKVDMFRSEPMEIDAALEIANAVTDILE